MMIVENEEEQNLSKVVFMIDKTSEEDSSPLLFKNSSYVTDDNVETAQQVESDSDKLFDDPKKKLAAVKSSDFLLACISMTLAIFSAGSIGPVFKYMESLGISPCLAASWRFILHYLS
jgi:hypothetical protein